MGKVKGPRLKIGNIKFVSSQKLGGSGRSPTVPGVARWGHRPQPQNTVCPLGIEMLLKFVLKLWNFRLDVSFIDRAGKHLIDNAIPINKDRRRQPKHPIGLGSFAVFIQNDGKSYA